MLPSGSCAAATLSRCRRTMPRLLPHQHRRPPPNRGMPSSPRPGAQWRPSLSSRLKRMTSARAHQRKGHARLLPQGVVTTRRRRRRGRTAAGSASQAARATTSSLNSCCARGARPHPPRCKRTRLARRTPTRRRRSRRLRKVRRRRRTTGSAGSASAVLTTRKSWADSFPLACVGGRCVSPLSVLRATCAAS